MATDKIIVALDYDTGEEALGLVQKLKPILSFFKVGSQLFTQEGPEIVKKLRAEGVDVMLDLKFHDIPATVAHAIKAAKGLGCRFATIHTSGGAEMMREAQLARQDSDLQLLGITVLTSLNKEDLSLIGFDHTVPGQVMHLARLASESGLEGLVCSAQELSFLRSQLEVPMTLVTPGIRPTHAQANDQQRTMPPAQALEEGADHLVIGRPITQAKDPLEAAQTILEECGIKY